MKTVYVVKFMKWFTSGHLAGLTHDSVLTFSTLDGAAEYVSFCNAHVDVAVEAIGSSNYTCHSARIETVSVSDENLQSVLSVNRGAL